MDLARMEHRREPFRRYLEGALDRAALHRLHVLYASSPLLKSTDRRGRRVVRRGAPLRELVDQLRRGGGEGAEQRARAAFHIAH